MGVSLKRRGINKNNLLPWFTQDHGTLPASYLASCEEFFKRIKKTPAAPYKNFFWPTIPQRQASSSKPQATSDKLLTNKDYRIIKDI